MTQEELIYLTLGFLVGIFTAVIVLWVDRRLIALREAKRWAAAAREESAAARAWHDRIEQERQANLYRKSVGYQVAGRLH
jgi:hypothetical protein